MSKVRVHSFCLSIDGFGAGAEQSLEDPLGGGVATIRQYLQAGLVDSIHLAMTTALVGRGESLFAGIDMNALGFTCTERTAGENATHVVLNKAT